jgi:hypothetical protein
MKQLLLILTVIFSGLTAQEIKVSESLMTTQNSLYQAHRF